MGWDEALFGWVYRGARALAAPRADAAELARRATLAGSRDRLRSLASALAETPIEIREGEREGGFADRTLLLPESIAIAPTPEENEDAYTLRVAWSIAAMKLDLVWSGPTAQRYIATLMAAPAIRAALLELCPGVSERLARHERLALEAEGAVPAAGAARALTWLRRAALGDALPADVPERAWVERALAARPSDRASLERAVREAAPALSAMGGPAPAPIVPAIWGWIGSPRDPRALDASPAASPEALPTGTELAGKPRERVKRIEKSQDPLQDNPLVHAFEKVRTAEEHRGGSKNADGSDELAEHADALRELDLREVIRTDERTASLLRCDVMLESGAGDRMDEGDADGIPYDEWNEADRAYRKGWCAVRVARLAMDGAQASIADLRARSRRSAEAIRAELARVELARRWRARQPDGPEPDDDALVDRFASLAAGQSGPDRLYRARPRSAAELAVVLLVDASLSTDAWVDDRRVLDVELESAFALAEGLDGPGIELGIAAFHSHTRRDCRFDVIKGMAEDWEHSQLRLTALKPAGYTRIGPALRHATAVLERTHARRRLLLLLTDGKPNDYDRYEGRYGIADVRQAVREAAQRSVHVHALALDPRARAHLPRMFGQGRHTVVSGPHELALALAQACLEMRR